MFLLLLRRTKEAGPQWILLGSSSSSSLPRVSAQMASLLPSSSCHHAITRGLEEPSCSRLEVSPRLLHSIGGGVSSSDRRRKSSTPPLLVTLSTATSGGGRIHPERKRRIDKCPFLPLASSRMSRNNFRRISKGGGRNKKKSEREMQTGSLPSFPHCTLSKRVLEYYRSLFPPYFSAQFFHFLQPFPSPLAALPLLKCNSGRFPLLLHSQVDL